MYRCAHRVGVAKQADLRGPVDDAPAERTVSLVANDEQVGCRIAYVVFQMVMDPAAAHHTAAGDDDGAGPDLVDHHRFRSRFRHVKVGQLGQVRVGAEQARAVQVPVLGIGFCRLDAHRAVQEDVPVPEVPIFIMFGHQVQDVLGTADRECRDQDVPVVCAGFVEYLRQLVDGLLEWPVQPVAIGALHQHRVG